MTASERAPEYLRRTAPQALLVAAGRGEGLREDDQARLDGKARLILKEMFWGQVVLTPTARGLEARSALHRGVLLRADKRDGSGGRIWIVSSGVERSARVK